MWQFGQLGERDQVVGMVEGRRLKTDFRGGVPKGMTHYEFGSRHVLILGRAHANGTDADYKAVNALHVKYKINPRRHLDGAQGAEASVTALGDSARASDDRTHLTGCRGPRPLAPAGDAER